MLSLLANSSFWIGALIIVALVLIIYLWGKFPHTRIVVGLLVFILGSGSAIYCGYQIYAYGHTKSSTFGKYQGEAYSNQVIVDNLIFNFKNIEMVAAEAENVYSASMSIGERIPLEKNKDYTIRVNSLPCSNVLVNSSTGYISAQYSYNFYNEDLELTKNDTIDIRFSITKNTSTIILRIKSGSDGVKFWNAYFAKNDFIVSVEPTDSAYLPDIEFGQGQVNYAVANFHLTDAISTVGVFKPGDYIKFPVVDDENFSGWALTPSGDNISQKRVINDDIEIYAKYERNGMTDIDYSKKAFDEMKDGILDLSLYPIKETPTVSEQERKGMIFNQANIIEVDFPNTLNTVSLATFKNCKSINKIWFSKGVLKTIDFHAFEGTNITYLEIPDSVEKISPYSFKNTSLETIIIGQNVRFVMSCAFENCSKLKTVFIPGSVEYISDQIYPSGDKQYRLGPFGFASPELTIYTDAQLKSENWHTFDAYKFDSIEDKIVYAPVVYGINLASFKEINKG